MNRQVEYRKRKLADGWKQKSFLLDPTTLALIEKHAKIHGSAAETIRAAMIALDTAMK